MIKNFENVCTTMYNAKTMENEAEMVLNVLLYHEGEMMRPKDIAKECRFGSGFGTNNEFVNYQRVTHPLKWLVTLGLVEKIRVDGEPIEIPIYKFICDNGYIFEFDSLLKCTHIKNIFGLKGCVEESTRTIIPKISMYKIIA